MRSPVTVVAKTTEREAAARLVLLEAGAAWFEYLQHTRDLAGPRYVEVEMWAWIRLQARLEELARRFEGRFG